MFLRARALILKPSWRRLGTSEGYFDCGGFNEQSMKNNQNSNKNQPTCNQKSTQNPSTIYQSSFKNRSTFDQNSIKNDIENQADLKSENERCIIPREITNKLFLEAQAGPEPLQDAFETALVLHHIFSALFLRSWLDLPSQLGSQNPSKSTEKSMPRWPPMLTSFFDRFGIDFGSQLGPSEANLDLAG